MTVFRGYLLIIKRNVWSIMMYIAIFVGIAVMIQASYQNSSINQGFTTYKLNMAVIDRDGGVLADAVRTLMDREQHLVDLADDQQVIQDELFYNNVEYVLVIPEGAEEKLARGEMALQSISAPNSIASYYAQAQADAFLNQVKVCLECGFPMEEACRMVLAAAGETADVRLMDVNGNAGIREGYNYYFLYMPYAFLGATVMTMGIVIMEIKKRDIRRRMQSSAVPFFRQNLAAVSSFALVGLAIWAVCILLGSLLYQGGIFKSPNAGLYLLNSLCCMLVSLSLGYLTGMVAGGPNSLSGFSNVVTLGLCFLGGIFVPLEMLGDGVRRVSQILPTYWYTVINDTLGDYEVLSPEKLSIIRKGLLIQVLFATACFGITLAIRRIQMRENS